MHTRNEDAIIIRTHADVTHVSLIERALGSNRLGRWIIGRL